MQFEYIIVGSGLTGAVIARTLRDAGKSVLVIDRRPHLAGNIHDHVHASGIPIHSYGPHYFRTNSDELWAFVSRFAAFRPYEPCLKSLVDGQFENWPIARDYIERKLGPEWAPAFAGEAANFEEASMKIMPRLVYEKFVKGYTEKQWGVPASSLSAALARRFDVREDNDPRLSRHKHQGIPEHGYTALVRSMLEGVPTLLNVDYLRAREHYVPGKALVFTGPIDEYYDYDLGKLRYRGQRRVHEYHPEAGFLQPCGQVNNPAPMNGDHIRSLEWKHMMDPRHAKRIRGTVISRETPFTPDDPSDYEYPFPDEANAALYRRYRERADRQNGVLICGRLGEYRYYDMDQAIARARLLARSLLAPHLDRSGV